MTSALRPLEPVLLVDRLGPLHAELIRLLRGLNPGDWNRPTACALWSVRDITAHLLDDDLRRLSFHRDGQPPPAAGPIDGYASLVAMINRMNAEWVAVARRMSPRVLIELLEVTGPMVVELFRSIDPHARHTGRSPGRARRRRSTGSTSGGIIPSGGFTNSRSATRSARLRLPGASG